MPASSIKRKRNKKNSSYVLFHWNNTITYRSITIYELTCLTIKIKTYQSSSVAMNQLLWVVVFICNHHIAIVIYSNSNAWLYKSHKNLSTCNRKWFSYLLHSTLSIACLVYAYTTQLTTNYVLAKSESYRWRLSSAWSYIYTNGIFKFSKYTTTVYRIL